MHVGEARARALESKIDELLREPQVLPDLSPLRYHSGEDLLNDPTELANEHPQCDRDVSRLGDVGDNGDLRGVGILRRD